MRRAGRNESPYRTPCGGYAASDGIHINCNFDTTQDSVVRWQNATIVNALDGAENTITSAPYPRPDDICSGGSVIPATDCYPTTTSATKYCAGQDWGLSACPTEDATHDTRYENCYVSTTSDATYSDCRQGWFRNKQALKIWHGRFGFLSHDPLGRINLLPNLRNPDDYNTDYCNPDVTTDCTCSLETEQSTPDTTKYLSLDAEAWSGDYIWDGSATVYADVSTSWDFDLDNFSPDPGTYAHAERHVGVNQHSGITTQSPTCGDSDPNNAASLITGYYAVGADVCRGLFLTALDGYRLSEAGNYTITFSASGSWSEITADVWDNDASKYVAQFYLKTGPDTASVKIAALNYSDVEYDPGTGYEFLKRVYYPTEYREWIMGSATAEYIYTNGFEWNPQPVPLQNPSTGYYERNYPVCSDISAVGHLLMTLSSAYTASALYGDVMTLLDSWSLTSDVHNDYSWRSDDYVAVAPLLCRNEYLGPITPTPQDCGWTDSATFDGTILGTPNPPGYDNHFDFTHKTWEYDAGCPSAPFVAYVGAYAGPSPPEGTGDATDAVMPKTATQWTENWWCKTGEGQTGINPLGAGRWLHFYANSLLAQDWLERRILRPSNNFFRPCGADRFSLDETQTACVVTLTGNNTAGDPYVATLHTPVDVTTGTQCYYGGYVWEVTKNSTTQYQLDFPSLFEVDEAPDDSFVFGPIRWPNAWPICGHREIAGVSSSGGVVTVTLKTPARFLRTGDIVDFTDGNDVTTEANQTVTAIDDTSFSFSGSEPTGTHVKSHGAPHYKWNDNQPKFDYQIRTWAYDYRDIGEADRLCAQYATCSVCDGCTYSAACSGSTSTLRATQTIPAIKTFTCTDACLTPDCDMTLSGDAFPETFTADERYGAKWWTLPVQHIQDPYWQAPHTPCVSCAGGVQVSECAWSEDSGLCATDTCTNDCEPEEDSAKYYPHRPYIEAICALPAGAPTLPASLTLGCPALADCNPPAELTGENLPITMPWTILQAQQTCACAETPGRFSEDYGDNFVVC